MSLSQLLVLFSLLSSEKEITNGTMDDILEKLNVMLSNLMLEIDEVERQNVDNPEELPESTVTLERHGKGFKVFVRQSDRSDKYILIFLKFGSGNPVPVSDPVKIIKMIFENRSLKQLNRVLPNKEFVVVPRVIYPTAKLLDWCVRYPNEIPDKPNQSGWLRYQNRGNSTRGVVYTNWIEGRIFPRI